MNLLQFLEQSWPELLALTREHVLLVFVSTGLAILIGVPLGILLTRIKTLQTPILGFANVMQTVPSLALFGDRKSTRLNSSHSQISYAVFCLKKKIDKTQSYSVNKST